jgi:hypothetical protein
MAITYTHKGDWLAEDFEDAVPIIWNASTYGYGVDKWTDIANWLPKYGLWRLGSDQGKVAVGTFDSPQEVVAILKLILANEEQEQQQRRVQDADIKYQG